MLTALILTALLLLLGCDASGQVAGAALGKAAPSEESARQNLARGKELLRKKAFAEAVELLRAATEGEVGSLEAHNCLALALEAIGKRDEALEHYSQVLALLELSGNARRLAGHAAPVRVVAFLPTNRLLVSASYDGTIRLWDAVAGSLVRTATGLGQAIKAMAVSPDGSSLATGGSDNTVTMWNVARWEP